MDAHVGNVSDLAFSQLKEQLFLVTCGEDRTVKVWLKGPQPFFILYLQGCWCPKIFSLSRCGVLLPATDNTLLKVMNHLFTRCAPITGTMFRYQLYFCFRSK